MRTVVALALLLLVACSGGSTCNCPGGCCDATGACQPGTQAGACGTGTCTVCSGTDRCGSTTRVCGPCGAANCSGCCTSDGLCFLEVRDRDTHCGFNGSACVDCTPSGKTCSTTTLACQ